MIKREELTNPKSCMSRAREDEMTFVLLARDAAAAATIRFWARSRIELGKNKIDDPQIVEALACANYMDGQRHHNELFPEPPLPEAQGSHHYARCPKCSQQKMTFVLDLDEPANGSHWFCENCHHAIYGVSPQDEVVKSSAPPSGCIGNAETTSRVGGAEQVPGQHMERRDRTDAHDAKVVQVPAATSPHASGNLSQKEPELATGNEPQDSIRQPYKGFINRPCSACSEDPDLEFHDHERRKDERRKIDKGCSFERGANHHSSPTACFSQRTVNSDRRKASEGKVS